MSTALARRHRTAQNALASVLTVGMADLWRSLVDDRGPRAVWPVLYPQMASMVQDHRAQSAELASRFYAQARAEAGVPGEAPRVEVRRAPDAQLEKSLAVTGLVSYERGIRAGRSPTEASEVAIVTVTGAAERLVAEGGRDAVAQAVAADDQAVGWYRLPGPSPCWWCAMLASRGAVYGSRESASVTEDGSRYHDHCGCEPWPVFSATETLPPEVQQWVDTWDASSTTDDPVHEFKQKVDEANAQAPEEPEEDGVADNPTPSESTPSEPEPPVEPAGPVDGGIRPDDLSWYDDDRLGEMLMEAFADDRQRDAVVLEEELERRSALDDAPDATAWANSDETDADRAARELEDAQYERMRVLVEEQGYAWEEAAAEVQGRTVEALRREDFVIQHRVGAGDRRSFIEVAREQYRLWVTQQWHAAEDATNGYLLTPAAQAAGVDPMTLFSGPRARAEAHASEELKRWWDQYGRMTFEDYTAAVEAGRDVRGPGRDFNR